PSLGIAAHARALGAHLEDAESGKLYLFALLKGLGHQLQGPLNKFRAVLTGQAHFLMNRLAQVGSCNRRAFHERPYPGKNTVTEEFDTSSCPDCRIRSKTSRDSLSVCPTSRSSAQDASSTDFTSCGLEANNAGSPGQAAAHGFEQQHLSGLDPPILHTLGQG